MEKPKNLIKKVLTAGAFFLASNFFIPEKMYSQIPKTQKQDTLKEQKLFPYLNFYFETGDDVSYVGMPPFKKNIEAWLSSDPKENKNGNIWFYYGDTDNDGIYDYVSVLNHQGEISFRESFQFNFDTKKIDYFLGIYDCQKSTNCDKIITKSYDGIDQKEAEYLGSGFFERIKEFAKTQKEFNRFNSEQLENLVRKEAYYKLKINNEKLVGNSRIPIRKFLSEEEIKKVENYVKAKPERERLKKEQEEKLKELQRQQEEAKKIEDEKQEKIRLEQEEKFKAEQEKIRLEQKEARKPKANLKVGASIGKYLPSGIYGNSFFEINPAIKYGSKNIKNKMGFDLMYGSFKIKSWGDKIKYNAFRAGLNLGIVFPSSKIEYDYLKVLFSRYTINKNDKNKVAYIHYFNNYFGVEDSTIYYHEPKDLSFSLGQKLEFFPFKDYLKNLSFSLEAGGIVYTNDLDYYFEGRAGIKYTFGKNKSSKTIN